VSHAWPGIKRFDDPREHVTKLVFVKPDAIAEAVVYRYPSYKERTVICCSVQSGCKMGCTFCGTGKRFIRQLTPTEICDQVDYALEEVVDVSPDVVDRLQIMFMSMGEPLLSPHVDYAVRLLAASYPSAQLLLSTAAPDVSLSWLFKLSMDVDRVGLQFSVHASTDDDRNKLIPFRQKMGLAKIAAVGECWHAATGRHPFFNYCAGPNNSRGLDACRLRTLFNPLIWKATVSVICNAEEGVPGCDGLGRAQGFSTMLVEQGFDVRVFDPAGQDTIGGGCGQLWYTQEWMEKRYAE